MDLINEAEIRDTWSPIIESATGITESAKLGWMSTLCHNHKLYEDANIMSLNPTMNLMGMGAASVGTQSALSTGDGSGDKGSGDKAPTLLPLAMQVAGQTIALDLVPVVPMAGPMGLLSYLDFTYQGGTTTNKVAPTYVKCTLTGVDAGNLTTYLALADKDLAIATEGSQDFAATIDGTPSGTTAIVGTDELANWPATGFVAPAAGTVVAYPYLSHDSDKTFTFAAGVLDAAAITALADTTAVEWRINADNVETDVTSTGYTYLGTSRIDGKHIFELTGDIVHSTVAADIQFAAEAHVNLTGASAVGLVNGLEDHIAGFSAANNDGDPYSREAGESTPDKLMGLTLYSKTVAAETFQAAAAVTREQVQDLKQFGVDAVAQVEGVLVNEVTQSINALILKKLRAHGDANAYLTASTSVLDLNLGANAGLGNTPGSDHRRIMTQILAAANYIANKGRRGAGNFAVVSARVASVLQSVSGFVPNPIANTVSQVAGGIYPLGSVAGVNLYTDPSVAWAAAADTTEDILVGRKGDGNGAGVVFMPYLMAESVQVIAEGTMAPKVAIKSRFALVDAGHHPETGYANFHITGFAI